MAEEIVEALVFTADPVSSTGDLTLDPSASAVRLNRQRQSVKLRLDPPAGKKQAAAPQSKKQSGKDSKKEVHSLSSKYVTLVPSPAKKRLPERPVAGRTVAELRYGARSDEFSALNAFYHCDRIFRMIEETFGFELKKYFRGTIFPVQIVNRGLINGTVETVNAEVTLNDEKTGIGDIRFGLADLHNRHEPLGIATDARFVWHEFGHILLAGRGGRLEFKFAHSGGDALAAINCDPDSQLVDDGQLRGGRKLRGETMPWIRTRRRHDREPDGFWQWSGGFYDAEHRPDPRDPHGYMAEQLLSSTMFRLYRAIGGDALTPKDIPDVEERQRAAEYVTFLIVSAILLHDGGEAGTPAEFAKALIDADKDPRPAAYRNRPGARAPGTLGKVIHWAFDRQKLIATADEYAWPLPVDLYIDDGRAGEYGWENHSWESDWLAKVSDFWITPTENVGPDTPEHAPQAKVPCYACVRVYNRGSTAQEVRVTFHAALGRPDSRDGKANFKEIGTTPPKVVAPTDPDGAVFCIAWAPDRAGQHTLLAVAQSADDDSDPPLDVPLRDVVPHDNNIACRGVTVVRRGR